MTIDSCAWSAKECLRSSLPGRRRRPAALHRLRPTGLPEAEPRRSSPAWAEAIRPRRRASPRRPPACRSAEQREQHRDQHGDQDAGERARRRAARRYARTGRCRWSRSGAGRRPRRAGRGRRPRSPGRRPARAGPRRRRYGRASRRRVGRAGRRRWMPTQSKTVGRRARRHESRRGRAGRLAARGRRSRAASAADAGRSSRGCTTARPGAPWRNTPGTRERSTWVLSAARDASRRSARCREPGLGPDGAAVGRVRWSGSAPRGRGGAPPPGVRPPAGP